MACHARQTFLARTPPSLGRLNEVVKCFTTPKSNVRAPRLRRGTACCARQTFLARTPPSLGRLNEVVKCFTTPKSNVRAPRLRRRMACHARQTFLARTQPSSSTVHSPGLACVAPHFSAADFSFIPKRMSFRAQCPMPLPLREAPKHEVGYSAASRPIKATPVILRSAATKNLSSFVTVVAPPPVFVTPPSRRLFFVAIICC